MLYVRCSSILLRSAIIHSVLHPFYTAGRTSATLYHRVLFQVPRCCFRCSNSPQRDSSSSKKEVPKTGKKCCTRNSWSQTFSEWKRWSKLQGILVQAVLNLLFQATLCKPKVLDIFSQVNDLDKSLASSRCQIKEMCTHCIYFSRSLYVSSLVMLALHFSQGGLFPGSRQASREGL